MNEAIFFLYLAGVTENLLTISTLVLISCPLIAVFTFIAHDGELDEAAPALKRLFIIGVIAAPFAIFTPHKLVFLTMAGTEVGETTAQTDLGRKTLALIEKILDEELHDDEEDAR